MLQPERLDGRGWVGGRGGDSRASFVGRVKLHQGPSEGCTWFALPTERRRLHRPSGDEGSGALIGDGEEEEEEAAKEADEEG